MAYRVSCYIHSPHLNTPRSFKIVIYLILSPWSVVRGPWSVVRGPWSVVRGPWSVVRGPWSVMQTFVAFRRDGPGL